MSTEKPEIIKCECGQRMRLPADSQSKYFRCVKCGSFVDRQGVRKKDTQKIRRSDLKLSSARGLQRSALLGIFVDGGLISPQQGKEVSAVAKESRKKTFQAIIDLGFATREQLHAFLARESGAASISLSHFSIEQTVAALIPKDMVDTHMVLPIDKLGKSLTVAMVCPMDTKAVQKLEEFTSLRIRPMLCTWDDFEAACAKLYPESKTTRPELRLIKPAESDTPQEHAPVPFKVTKATVPEDTADEEEAELPDTAFALSDKLRQLKSLEIPARVMNRIDSVPGGDKDGLKKISQIIANSPPMTARIISTANSTAYGMSGKVDNVPVAVALLGAETIALVATGTPKQSLQGERDWYQLTRYTRHVAKISAALAAFTEKALPNVAYCAGLLHSIGSFALGAAAPDLYSKIDAALTGSAREEAEKTTLGMGHTEAGWNLAQAWNLPEIITSSLTHYLAPENSPDFQDLAYIVHLATALGSADGALDITRLDHLGRPLDYLKTNGQDVAQALSKSPFLAAAESAK